MIINECVLDVASQYGGASPGLVTTYDKSRYHNDGTLTNVTWTQLGDGLWVPVFNGTSSIIAVGNILSPIMAFEVWINPDDITTRSIIDLDGGTHSVEIDGAGDVTATGWAAPIIYVNGVVAAAVTLTTWAHIIVTSTTSFVGSNVTIGQETSFYDGSQALINLYTYVLTPAQIRAHYHSTKWLFGVPL